MNLKEWRGTTRSSWSAVRSNTAGYCTSPAGTVMLCNGEYLHSVGKENFITGTHHCKPLEKLTHQRRCSSWPVEYIYSHSNERFFWYCHTYHAMFYVNSYLCALIIGGLVPLAKTYCIHLVMWYELTCKCTQNHLVCLGFHNLSPWRTDIHAQVN